MTQDYEDYSHEEIIGEITHVFLFSESSERFTRTRQYVPYNLIFTKNYILGDFLRVPAVVTITSTLTDFFKKPDFSDILTYMPKGEVVDKSGRLVRSETFNNIKAVFEYGKIAECSLWTRSQIKTGLGEKPIMCNALNLKVTTGLTSDGYVFLFADELSAKATDLLKSTPLVNKIVVR